MKRRAVVIVVALGGVLIAALFWPSRRSERPIPATIAEVEAPPVAPSAPSPEPWAEAVTAAVVSPPEPAALTAEQVLRELEPLSLTDKPLALSRALEADARLSPDGVMAEARRALIVTLMVDTERMPEARARAREFIQRYPQSRYLPLVQGTTGIHPRPTPSQLRDAR